MTERKEAAAAVGAAQGGPEGFPGRVPGVSVHPGPGVVVFWCFPPPKFSSIPVPQAMADPSLLSAELEADEEEEAALRRLLLQVGPGRGSRSRSRSGL